MLRMAMNDHGVIAEDVCRVMVTEDTVLGCNVQVIVSARRASAVLGLHAAQSGLASLYGVHKIVSE